MEKFAISVIRKSILRSAVQVIQKLLKLNYLLLTNMNFSFIQTYLHRNPENLVNISRIKNEPFDWNITLSSNGTPISYKKDTGDISYKKDTGDISYKKDTGAQYVILTKSLENITPKPDLQPVNVKLYACNGSNPFSD